MQAHQTLLVEQRRSKPILPFRRCAAQSHPASSAECRAPQEIRYCLQTSPEADKADGQSCCTNYFWAPRANADGNQLFAEMLESALLRWVAGVGIGLAGGEKVSFAYPDVSLAWRADLDASSPPEMPMYGNT